MFISTLLICLSANGQEFTSSYILSTVKDHSHPDIYNSTHNEMFHLMYNDTIHNDLQNINNALEPFTSILDENTFSELIYKTESPYGHVMTIATVEAKGNSYAILSAFRKGENSLKKEFEYISVISESEPVNPNVIHARRDLWVEHSNNKRPELVVGEVYAEHAYYLNRGKLLNDNPSIVREYGYMLNPGWSIQLVSEGMFQVNNRTVIEIGTYAEGQGQYLLIWRLQQDELWKIALDFNF